MLPSPWCYVWCCCSLLLIDQPMRPGRTHIDLQVLSGLGQTQGVKAAVSWQAAVQPCGAGGVREPQGIACSRGGGAVGGSGRSTSSVSCSPHSELQLLMLVRYE
jgi:hypothetical protein